jgi:hypothetical protein
MQQSNRHIEFDDVANRPTARVITQEQPETKKDTVNNPQLKKATETDNQKKRIKVKEIIDGTFLVRENVIRQLPYLLFMTFLGVVYIGNRFHAEHMVREISNLKIEVSNLRAEQITTTSELMNISRPSEVAALVESKGLGLKESLEPPKKLKR